MWRLNEIGRTVHSTGTLKMSSVHSPWRKLVLEMIQHGSMSLISPASKARSWRTHLQSAVDSKN